MQLTMRKNCCLKISLKCFKEFLKGYQNHKESNMNALLAMTIYLLTSVSFMNHQSPNLKTFPIADAWWSCSCGHSNPAGTTSCEICYKSK